MKRLIVLIILLIASVSFAAEPILLARTGQGYAGGGASAAACTTIKQEETAAEASYIPNNTEAKIWNATRFKAASDFTVCAIALSIYKNDSPVMDETLVIYTDVDTLPGAALDCADPTSETINAATFPADGTTFVKFSGMNCALTNNTYYWIVKKSSATSTTNYTKWGIGDGVTELVKNDDASGTWAGTPSSTKTGKYSIYGN